MQSAFGILNLVDYFATLVVGITDLEYTLFSIANQSLEKFKMSQIHPSLLNETLSNRADFGFIPVKRLHTYLFHVLAVPS